MKDLEKYDSAKILSLLSECEQEIVYWKGQYEQSQLDNLTKQEEKENVEGKSKDTLVAFLQEQLETTQNNLEEEHQENLKKRQENQFLTLKVEELNAHLKKLYILYEQDQNKVTELKATNEELNKKITDLQEQQVVREDLLNELKKRNTYNEMNMQQMAKEFQNQIQTTQEKQPKQEKQEKQEKPSIFKKEMSPTIYKIKEDSNSISALKTQQNLPPTDSPSQSIILNHESNSLSLPAKLQIRLQVCPSEYQKESTLDLNNTYMKIYLNDLEENIEVNQQIDIEIDSSLLEQTLNITLYDGHLQLTHHLSLTIQDISIQKQHINTYDHLQVVLLML